MLDFIGTVVTAHDGFAVNAVSSSWTFPFRETRTCTRHRLWIRALRRRGAAGMIAISKPFPFVGIFVALPLSRRRSQRVGPPCAAQC